MPTQVYVNPDAGPVPGIAASLSSGRRPLEFHRAMPGYAPTPLVECRRLAKRLGVRRVLVKNEATRLGLPSFKILGASWATAVAVQRAWMPHGTGPLTVSGLAEGLRAARDLRLVAATDGNHGRGVARMARLLGVGCEILVPAGTAQARIEAIESEGALVRVVDGSYDDAIVASAAMADKDSLVISDTSWEGYRDIPALVIEGYSTMFGEVDDEIAARHLPRPDVLALQAGVGALAAAALRHYRGQGDGPGDASHGPHPATVVVEPLSAACLLASARAGRLTEAPGPHTSTMAGLNCGWPSQLAWPVVRAGTDVFVAIDDEQVHAAMVAMAEEGVVAGESGAAGLAGLMALANAAPVPAEVPLHADACVLVVNTEGATDPVNYAAVVGRTPAEVLRQDSPAVVAREQESVR